MGKFKYKYEVVKNIKEIQEARIQKEIAEFDLNIHNLKNEFDNVNEMQKRYAEDNLLGNVKALDIKYHKEYINHLENIKIGIKENIIELQRGMDKKKEELVQKTKEKKIFSKLEEKHFEEYNFQQNKIDALNLDEIAIQRFTRK
ncbi:MAG: hypothetical protein SCALA702_26760 [Melioribacteraceae bacterium]|nr:MAG: hypothetical protein SCALA702_26760 [Melioribacteraceae bacterium]